MARRFALVLLLIYLSVLTTVSLLNFGTLPKLGSSFDDKIFHFLSHALLTYLCFNYFKKTTVSKPIFISAVVPICYGITIEALQGIITDFRIPDSYDLLANFLGTIFAVLIISIAINVKLK